MDYGRLIRQSWALTWRYRFLWILGIFAGSAAGMPSFGGGNGAQLQARAQEIPQAPPGVPSEIATWTAENIGLIVTIAIVAALIGLVFAILSCIAQGGMARATTELATGQSTSLGRAWRVGLRLFWRYVGLWLLLIAAAIVVAAIFAALGAIVVAAGQDGMGGPVVLAVLLGLVLALLVIAAAIVISIVVNFAQRAIAVEDLGPINALEAGWRIFRSHVGESLLVWVISIGLAIIAGIVVAIVLIPIAAILFGLGAAVYASAGLGGLLIAYAVLGVIALIIVGAVLGGIVNTFFWHYWSLVYLRFTGHAGELVAAT